MSLPITEYGVLYTMLITEYDQVLYGLLLNKLPIETKICHFLQKASLDFDETF